MKIFAFIFLLIFCGLNENSFASAQSEKENLSSFISAFTECNWFDFDTGKEIDLKLERSIRFPQMHLAEDYYLSNLLYFGIFHNFIHNRSVIQPFNDPEGELGKFIIDKKFVFDTVKEYFGIDVSKRDFSILDDEDEDEVSLINSSTYDGKVFHFDDSWFQNNAVYFAEVLEIKKKGSKNLLLTGELYDSKNKNNRTAKFEAVVKPVKNSWNIISMNTVWNDRFPDLAMCRGNKVRLRENPDTNSKIIGQLNENTTFILLDAKEVNGEKWYLIDHPSKKGSAWIFGKYVEKYYKFKDCDYTPAHEIAMQLRLDYGITPEKTRALLGKPLKTLKDAHGNFAGLKYKDYDLYYEHYDDSGYNIKQIQVGYGDDEGKAKGNFGPIKIGDDKTKLFKIFGNNIRDEENFVNVDLPSGEVMYFNFDENNKISSMNWMLEEH